MAIDIAPYKMGATRPATAPQWSILMSHLKDNWVPDVKDMERRSDGENKRVEVGEKMIENLSENQTVVTGQMTSESLL